MRGKIKMGLLFRFWAATCTSGETFSEVGKPLMRGRNEK